MKYTLELSSKQAAEESNFIKEHLEQFNLALTVHHQYAPLKVFARTDQGKLIGGLLGETFWSWLHVEILWVDEAYRRIGLGKQLMQRAEEEAKSRGCQYAFLDTFDFQAPGFYRKIGYMEFGVLQDFPPGHQRVFFQKDLGKN